MKKIGLIINPLAGIGGPMGLKGSDGDEIVEKALAMGAVPQSENRVRTALEVLKTWSGEGELVMPSNNLILCRPLLLLPPIPPSIRVFSNESALHIR